MPSLLVPKPDRAEGSQEVVWRTDLVATAPYWEGTYRFLPHHPIVLRMLTRRGGVEWYLHLSASFLSVRAAKLLVLAGQERLDRELMVGQMSVFALAAGARRADPLVC